MFGVHQSKCVHELEVSEGVMAVIWSNAATKTLSSFEGDIPDDFLKRNFNF